MDFTRCETGVATSYISYIYICVYLHTYKSTVVDGRTVERGYSSEHDRGKKASKKNAAKTRGVVTFSLCIAQSMTAKKEKKKKKILTLFVHYSETRWFPSVMRVLAAPIQLMIEGRETDSGCFRIVTDRHVVYRSRWNFSGSWNGSSD